MKSKKGALLFSAILVVFVIGILLYAWATLTAKYKKFDRNIGERQYELINTYQRAEKTLFYIDQSAKYAAQETVNKFAGKGGFYLRSDCGTFNEADIWVIIEKDRDKTNIIPCYPSNNLGKLKDDFLKTFNDIFSSYLAIYPENIPALYEYDLSDNSEIIGKAKEKLEIDIVSEGTIAKPKTAAPTTPTQGTAPQPVLTGIPPKLSVSMQIRPGKVADVDSIRPEVWQQYKSFCQRVLNTKEEPPGACGPKYPPCCITSGYRSTAYNAEGNKGAPDSPHTYGVAIDVHVGRDLNKQIEWAKIAVEEGFFTRAGVYPGFTIIHLDLMPRIGYRNVKYWIGRGGQTLVSGNDLNYLVTQAKSRRIIT